MISIEVAQEEMDTVAEDLEEIRARLLGIRESLPPPPREAPREDDLPADPSGPVKIRAAIDCVLTDSIDSAIRGLRAVSKGQPQGEGEGEE